MNEPPPSVPSHEGQRTGMVIGRVLADGQLAHEATVMIVEGHASHPDVAAITDTSGEFQLGGLAPGWYNLEARVGERTGRRSVELGAGESAWVEFEVS